MITCPNCNEENINEAYFCHSCGYKLRNKTNGWRITAILFLILLIVLGCLVLNYNAEISYLESDCRYYQDRINSLNNVVNQKSATIYELETQAANYQSAQATIDRLRRQIQEKDAEISRLNNSYGDYYYYQNQVSSLNRQIENLQAQLPQAYYTKYAEQYVYNKCAGKYEKASCYFPSKGSAVTIYTTSDGYGLVHTGGWIPMNCLEKR